MKNAGHLACKQNTNLLEEQVSRLVTRRLQGSVDQQVPQEQREQSGDEWSAEDDDLLAKYNSRRAYMLNLSGPAVYY